MAIHVVLQKCLITHPPPLKINEVTMLLAVELRYSNDILLSVILNRITIYYKGTTKT